ncbi:MAG TPA: pirin family protein [Acidimicrobiales bacterium]|nr:pirin family protein [Acidimicrobiales bacterium]
MSNLDPHPDEVDLVDEPVAPDRGAPGPLAGRRVALGQGTEVRRYLPTRRRATVGAWCFMDAYGPDDVSGGPGMRVGPHPHTGLQTATWLQAGAVVHHDSLGNVGTIEPGQLNLMTAGSGVAHAEVSGTPHPRWLSGVQLWVALPAGARRVPPAVAHHPDLGRADLGPVTATVLVGELGGARSPAAVYSALVGAELAVGSGRAGVPLDPGFEHAALVLSGQVRLGDRPAGAGDAWYLGRGERRLVVEGDPSGVVLLLGGEPFTDPLVMWWNFVGGSDEEVRAAREDWEAGRRFGEVAGPGAGERMTAPPLPPGRLVVRR